MKKIKLINFIAMAALLIVGAVSQLGNLNNHHIAGAESMQNSFCGIDTRIVGSDIEINLNFYNTVGYKGYNIYITGQMHNSSTNTVHQTGYNIIVVGDYFKSADGASRGIYAQTFPTGGSVKHIAFEQTERYPLNETTLCTLSLQDYTTYKIDVRFVRDIIQDEGDEWLDDISVATLNVDYRILRLPANPTKEGYSFVGWYINEALTVPYTNQVITSDMNFYAKFIPIVYSISYSLNGGSISGEILNYNIESNLINLVIPTRTGYTFNGWYNNASFAGDSITNIPKGSIGDKTFYAKWTPTEYTISYSLNGGSMTGEPNTYTIVSGTITLPTPTKEGYTFKGWYMDAGFGGTVCTTIPSGTIGNKDFYAKWDINKYTINFVSNGGNSIDSITTNHGTTITNPAITREGYTFGGWFSNAECTQAFSFSNTITSNLTLYAKWAVKMFTVSFYVDGELYTSMSVAWGTVLTEAIEALSMRLAIPTSLIVPVNNSANIDLATTAVTSDMELEIDKLPKGFQKLGAHIDYFWANYWGYVVGGGAILLALAILLLGGKGKKSRSYRGR